MLWALLFIAGLVALLSGIIPLILNGSRVVNSVIAVLGVLGLLAGAVGVMLKPEFGQRERVAANTIESAPEPAPIIAPPPPEPDPAPVRTEAPAPPAPAPASPPAESPAKDESQLPQIKLPAPVSVTTTTVVGNEVDPLADPASSDRPATPTDSGAAAPPPAPAPQLSEAERLAQLAPQQARDEAAFTKAVSEARTAYDKAGYDDRAAVQSSRAVAICNAVKKPDVQGWIGAIKEIDRDAGGRTILAIALPDGTQVRTWNNAMSDIDDKTLILAGTPLAASVGKLVAGDVVRFTGTFFADEPDCYRSSRLSLDQSMTEPSFLFRFTSIDKT